MPDLDIDIVVIEEEARADAIQGKHALSSVQALSSVTTCLIFKLDAFMARSQQEAPSLEKAIIVQGHGPPHGKEVCS